MTTKLIRAVALLLLFQGGSAGASMPTQRLSPTKCLAEWDLAVESAGRVLSVSELAAIAACTAAELVLLRNNAKALSGQSGFAQLDFAPRPHSKGTIAAARDLVSRYRQGTPDASWYQNYWSKHGQNAVFASEILFDGNALAVKQAAVAAGHSSAMEECSRFCIFMSLIQSEPTSDSERLAYLLKMSSTMADMAGVRLGELPASMRDLAFSQLAGSWPSAEAARKLHEARLFSLFVALRAVGDDRHSDLDFSTAVAPIRQRVHTIRSALKLAAGQRDLRFTREGFLVAELVRMRRI